MAKSYSDKLRDPRWQKKRLEVFERDGFCCLTCGNDKNELHVHHKFYDGREPWEYELSALETICKSCHEKEHNRSPLRTNQTIDIRELIARIKLTRALIPSTEYPNTGWIEDRLDKMTAELNNNLNIMDRG